MNVEALDHVNIITDKLDATADFYGKLFGWTFQHFTDPGPYTIFESGNVPGGLADIGDRKSVV